MKPRVQCPRKGGINALPHLFSIVLINFKHTLLYYAFLFERVLKENKNMLSLFKFKFKFKFNTQVLKYLTIAILRI